MKYFNGRMFVRQSALVDEDTASLSTVGNLCPAFIAAKTKKRAIEIGKEVDDAFCYYEMRTYWSDCWGITAKAHLPSDEEGVWILTKSERFVRFLPKQSRKRK